MPPDPQPPHPELLCPARERFEQLLVGSVSAQERAALESHLTTCDACAALFVAEFDSDARWEKWDRLLRNVPGRAATQHTRGAGDATQLEPPAPSWFPPPPALPARLASYEVLHEIGRGGMGVVYRARDRRLRREVAIKLLLAGALAGPERSQRFGREAVVIARLDHPHIVRIHEVGDHEGAPFLSLEYVAGPTLAQQSKERPHRPDEAARLVRTLAGAIGYAHDHGVVHRDLKPSNILLQRSHKTEGTSLDDWTPKVTDFGLAKLAGSDDLTQTGEVMGTPSYMAPELLLSDELARQSPSIDVYSLGAILYELLTGRPPIRASSTWETIKELGDCEPVAPRVLEPAIPRDLETITLKAIQRDPTKRYASAEQLQTDLERFLQRRPILARPVSWPERLRQRARRHPWAAITLVVTSISVLALLVLWAQFTHSLSIARHDAVAETERAEHHLQQAQDALRHYLEQVQADQRLGAQGLESLRQSLIQEALAVYEELVTETASEELLVDYAQAHFQLGTILRGPSPQQAADHFRKAIVLLQGPIDRDCPLADCYSSMISARISLAEILEANQEYRPASAELAAAEEAFQGLVGKAQTVELTQWKRARLHRAHGRLFEKLDEPQQAQSQYERAIVLADRLPSISDFYLERSQIRTQLGTLLTRQGHPEGAVRLREALAIAREVVQTARPVLSRYRRHLSTVCSKLGQHTKSPREAAALYREAATQQVRLVRDYPAQSESHLGRLTAVLEEAGRVLGQHKLASELEQLRALQGDARPRSEALQQARVCLNEGYRALQATFDTDRAVQAFQQALDQLESLNALVGVEATEAREFQCIAWDRLAVAFWRLGEDRRCDSAIQTALGLAEDAYVNRPQLHLLLARVRARLGDYPAAQQYLATAQGIPPELGAYRAQAALLSAAAAAQDHALAPEERIAVARQFLKDCDAELRRVEDHPVGEFEYGQYPLAKLYATWVAVAEALRPVLGGQTNSIADRHRQEALRLLSTLCAKQSQGGFRDAIRADVQFAALRGDRLTTILNQ